MNQHPRASANVRAEEAAIGRIIVDGSLSRSIIQRLSAEHFTVPHHREILEAVQECLEQNKEPSLALIEAKLPTVFEGVGDVEPVLQILIEKSDGVSLSDFVDELDVAREARESARQQSGPKRIHLIPFDRIKPTKRPRGLIKGLLSREGLIVVWGPPKCMKTFIVLDWCFHIALGWPYRGRRVTQGPVVYCGFEGQAELPARVEAFRRSRLQGEAMRSVPFFLQPVTVDLVRDHALLIAAISTTLIRTPPVAVVLDTLNRSLRGSESSDEDMGSYVRAADAIRDAFACAVIVVHHSGIDTNRPRGHTSLTGAADVQLSVRRDGDDRIIVKIDAAKDMPAGVELVSTFETVEVGTDEDGDPVTSCVIVEAEGSPDRLGAARKKLPQKPFAALRGLHNCIADLGSSAPTGSRAPAGIKGVTLDQWRDELLKTALINSKGNHREEFKRIRVTLQNTASIGIYEEFVWPVT